MKTGLVLGALLLASCTAICAQMTKAQEPAADPATKPAEVPAETTATVAAEKPAEVVTIAANKLPGKIIIPPETLTSCPTISGNECSHEACIDPEGGPGDICHKTGCTIINTGLHGCQGDDDPFICPRGQTIRISSCSCACLGEACGSYGSWYCQ